MTHSQTACITPSSCWLLVNRLKASIVHPPLHGTGVRPVRLVPVVLVLQLPANTSHNRLIGQPPRCDDSRVGVEVVFKFDIVRGGSIALQAAPSPCSTALQPGHQPPLRALGLHHHWLFQPWLHLASCEIQLSRSNSRLFPFVWPFNWQGAFRVPENNLLSWSVSSEGPTKACRSLNYDRPT